MVRSMVSSMVRSMVRSVSQGSRSGWSVSSMSRLRVDSGSLVSHVGNESALSDFGLFLGILNPMFVTPPHSSFMIL